jgi:hypothetical protein
MVGWPPGRLRVTALEAHRPQIQLLDEGLYNTHGVIRPDVVLDTLRQQHHLGSVRAFDESLHLPASTTLDASSNAKHPAFVYSTPTFLRGLGRTQTNRHWRIGRTAPQDR